MSDSWITALHKIYTYYYSLWRNYLSWNRRGPAKHKKLKVVENRPVERGWRKFAKLGRSFLMLPTIIKHKAEERVEEPEPNEMCQVNWKSNWQRALESIVLLKSNKSKVIDYDYAFDKEMR